MSDTAYMQLRVLPCVICFDFDFMAIKLDRLTRLAHEHM